MDFDRISSIYDREIVPVWGRPFSQLLVQKLPNPLTGTVVEVGCGTGYLTIELAQRLADKARLIALEPSLEMIEIAFEQGEQVVREGKVLFQRHSLNDFQFADGVLDLIFSNLGLFYIAEPDHFLFKLLRLLKPGAPGVFTLPMRGSFENLFSVLSTTIERLDERELLRQLKFQRLGFPSPEEALFLLQRSGFGDVSLELHPFQMIFSDAAALLESAFFRHHFLLEWRPFLQKIDFQELLAELRDVIDVYRAGEDVKLWVRAGCLQCHRPLISLPRLGL